MHPGEVTSSQDTHEPASQPVVHTKQHWIVSDQTNVHAWVVGRNQKKSHRHKESMQTWHRKTQIKPRTFWLTCANLVTEKDERAKSTSHQHHDSKSVD